jgi:hypothetical protein
MLRVIAFLSILPFFSGCVENKSFSDIDQFIRQFENEDFVQFKNISITLKSKNLNKAIYILIKTNSNLPAYIITYDLVKKHIVEIDHSLLAKAGIEDYFSDHQLANYIDAFRKYDFYLMSVDNDCNVYVNPFHANQPICLMRLNTSVHQGMVQKGYLYEQYKGRWYINISSMELK